MRWQEIQTTHCHDAVDIQCAGACRVSEDAHGVEPSQGPAQARRRSRTPTTGLPETVPGDSAPVANLAPDRAPASDARESGVRQHGRSGKDPRCPSRPQSNPVSAALTPDHRQPGAERPEALGQGNGTGETRRHDAAVGGYSGRRCHHSLRCRWCKRGCQPSPLGEGVSARAEPSLSGTGRSSRMR